MRAGDVESGLQLLKRPLEAPAILARDQASRLPQRERGDWPLRDHGKELLGKLTACLQRLVVARILLSVPLHIHQDNVPAANFAAEDLLKVMRCIGPCLTMAIVPLSESLAYTHTRRRCVYGRR
jgi:hypothetical protein